MKRNGVIYVKHSDTAIIRLTVILEGGDMPFIEAVLSGDRRSYAVSIDYKDYPEGFYRTGFDVLFKPYSGPFVFTSNTVIYAYGADPDVDMVSETSTAFLYEIDIPRPSIRFNIAPDQATAVVDIDYNGLPLMFYKTDEDLSWIEYIGQFDVNKNTVVYAKAGFDINTFSFISMLAIEQII